MLSMLFEQVAEKPLRLLCLGAHSDDIEIGCGGTILKWLEAYPNLQVHWVVFGADQPQRADEARTSANLFLTKAQTKDIRIKGFRDSFFPYIGAEIKAYFEELKAVAPDLILTHYREDFHQDHRLICELTWNTFRHHLILEYEIPKYDGDLGQPNVFVPLDEALCREKVAYLFEAFQTQTQRSWFSEDTFLALLRLRGVEAAAEQKYAEAFYCRKMIVK